MPGITLEELQGRGSQPVGKSGGLSLGQLQGQGSAPVQPLPQPDSIGKKVLDKTIGTLRGEATFKANTETSNPIRNILKPFGNIPSSAASFAEPFNPLTVDSPVNIGRALVNNPPKIIDLFKQSGSTKKGFENFASGFATNVDKTAATIGNLLKRAAVSVKDDPIAATEKILTEVSKAGIEDPLLLPTLFGSIAKGKFITKIAKPVTEGASPATGELLSKTGKVIKESGEVSADAKRIKFTEDLVSPVKTKKVLEADVSRTTEVGKGPFKRSVVKPSPFDKGAIEEVGKIKKVSPNNTIQGNFNIIAKENVVKAEKLKTDIAANDFVIPKREALAAVKRAKESLNDNILVVGDAERTAEKLLNKVKQILKSDKIKGTGSGLLQARKDFDAFVKSQKPKVFDASADNALTVSNKAIRDSLTEVLVTGAKRSGKVDIEASLKAQSNLFRALDNITPKAAKEANTAIGRAFDTLGKKLGTRNKLVQGLAAGAGIGVFGAAAAFAAPLTIGTGAVFLTLKAGKLVLKPGVRKALGDILEKAGKQLNPKDKKIIENLLKDFDETPRKQGGFAFIPKITGNRSKDAQKINTEINKIDKKIQKLSEANGNEGVDRSRKQISRLEDERKSLLETQKTFNEADIRKKKFDRTKQGGHINPGKIFDGFEDVTTKILSKLKGKTTVSKQFISDLTNSGDVRQVERDLIRDVLKESPPNVGVKEFADRVKTRLVPLETEINGLPETGGFANTRYENVSLPDNLRGNVANYTEPIYLSPIKNSAGEIHFSGDGFDNYFAHTRVEDLADSVIPFKELIKQSPTVRNRMIDVKSDGEIMHGTEGTTRRVIEIQSDLFQKGNLEREGFGIRRPTPDVSLEGLDPIFAKKVKIVESEMEKQRIILQPYRNTWHERIIREEVKRAAQDGKTKLQFPTGETAMKIEGLGETHNWISKEIKTFNSPLKDDLLKIGSEIRNRDGNTDWIITDVLEDGKFKATQLDNLSSLRKEGISKKEFEELSGKDKVNNLAFDESEQFDISGKVDTSNPIFKFYEKDVQKFLNKNFDAKPVTDDKGVKWIEVDIKKTDAKEPVQVFGMLNIPTTV